MPNGTKLFWGIDGGYGFGTPLLTELKKFGMKNVDVKSNDSYAGYGEKNSDADYSINNY